MSGGQEFRAIVDADARAMLAEIGVDAVYTAKDDTGGALGTRRAETGLVVHVSAMPESVRGGAKDAGTSRAVSVMGVVGTRWHLMVPAGSPRPANAAATEPWVDSEADGRGVRLLQVGDVFSVPGREAGNKPVRVLLTVCGQVRRMGVSGMWTCEVRV